MTQDLFQAAPVFMGEIYSAKFFSVVIFFIEGYISTLSVKAVFYAFRKKDYLLPEWKYLGISNIVSLLRVALTRILETTHKEKAIFESVLQQI